MSDWVPSRYIDRGDVTLALYEDGPTDGPPLLLLHGWPELAYSWAPVMPLLADAGYRVIAPDLRGFGASDCPNKVEDYHITEMVADVEAVIDDLGISSIPVIGHDWGGIILWHAARMIPKRISHVVSICTPFVRQAPVDPIAILRKRFGDEHYFVHFNDRMGEADKLFARDPDGFFRLMFRSVPDNVTEATPDFAFIPQKFEAFLDKGAPDLPGQILTPEQLAVYADTYAKTGFSGGINLYRNTTANWEYAAGLPDKITQPTLMISPDRDLLLPPSLTDAMVGRVEDMTRKVLQGSGHWAMWEQPEALSAMIIEWLAHKH